MAKKGMSVPEAATRIGVSDRTLRTYIKQGFLSTTKHRGDRRHYLDPLEVEEFKRDRDSSRGKSVVTKTAFLLMRSQVRRLQAQMDVVMRILDAKNDPLHMSLDYAKDLFSVCSAQLHNSEWTLTELEPWVEVFLRLDESDIDSIFRATDAKKSWKPFLQLCISMTAYVATHSDYEGSLELQMIHRRLAEGRRRLRISALIYEEMYGSEMDTDLKRYAFADSPSSLSDSLRDALRLPKRQ